MRFSAPDWVIEKGLLGFVAPGSGEQDDLHRREHRVNRAVN
jgi:hypothetical protein